MPPLRRPQSTHGRAQVGPRVVPERRDEVVAIEDGLDDAALNASAAAVDESDLGQAPLVCRPHVLVDDRGDVPGCERVKIEFRVDGDDVGGRGHTKRGVTPSRLLFYIPPRLSS
jgi:hypothetical protein